MSKATTESSKAPVPTGPIDVYKYRWVFLGISLLFLLPGAFYIVTNIMNPAIGAPVLLGIDFKGGTLLEYGFSKPVTQADIHGIRTVFDEHGYTGAVVQIQKPEAGINQKPVEVGASSGDQSGSDQNASTAADTQTETQVGTPAGESKASLQGSRQTPAPLSKPGPDIKAVTAPTAAGNQPLETTSGVATGNVSSIVSIRSKQIHGTDDVSIRKDLEAKYGSLTLLQKVSMGPSLAQELMTNGLMALLLAYLLIVGYLTFRFQFDFAVCAIIALVHDTLFLFGMFALFGHFFHTEVDSLFVTAILTVVGFSVHDTIVVFDRIRENNKLYFTKKVPFVDIVNMSVNQTMARSINTSLTALLTMLALYFWGGETTRDFVLAIIIGIASGTYSSIFNASVLLAMWRNRQAKMLNQAAVA